MAAAQRGSGQRGRRGAAPSAGEDFRTVEPAALMLLRGPEDYLASRALDRIKSQLRAQHPDLEYTRFDVSVAASGELATLASPSLFGEARMILAEDLAQMNDTFLADALAYLDEVAEDVTLVMRHSGGNRGKKLIDALAGRAVVVDCAAAKSDADKMDFLRREFRAAGREIQSDAARALVAAAGSSLSDLGGACQQLIRDVAGQITEDDVDRYHGGRVEATAFKVADAAFEGRRDAATRLYRHAVSTGVSPIAVTAALARKGRQIAALVDHRGSTDRLASSLGVPPWQLRQAAETARRWQSHRAAAAVEAVARADAEAKGASRTPEYAVERAIGIIAGSVGR
ncbi:DNA polymerase III subunit delta [Nesterenkonia sp. HG001]|uniref:DNA polymerase III subunit delta n=1 Tax=Nesterenkonia sp. HG001 TaxID=2983207 RepID=UPI002AC5C822|nr:DNA polymerase III subunit delta [Nesterenkonia sp. HG001]MDZ5077967.1 DNA polymerase III subunit delta [Nesterenkonia sp. HG001]